MMAGNGIGDVPRPVRAAVARAARGRAACSDLGPTGRLARRAARVRIRSLAAAFTAALALAGCGGEIPSGGTVGDTAPAYAAATLEGDTVALADLRGDVVLLNVWATWCAPCREETPDLQALYERHAGDGLHILGVSVDGAGSRGAVREFAREYGVTYSILLDPGERVSNVFRVRGVPTSLLIDRTGMVVWRGLGPVRPDDAAFVDALERALAAGAADDDAAAGR